MFDELVERVRSADLALLAAAGAPPLRSVLENTKEKNAGGLLVVGPEGDFTDDELSTNDYSTDGWFFRIQGRY